MEKPKGGIRPIAVGEIMRRLASKCAAGTVVSECADYLSPHQLGVGVRGGAEAIVHSVNRVIEEHANRDDLSLLKIDFSNAFNAISRKAVFEQVRLISPSISNWVEFCYGSKPWLFVGERVNRVCNKEIRSAPFFFHWHYRHWS